MKRYYSLHLFLFVMSLIMLSSCSVREDNTSENPILPEFTDITLSTLNEETTPNLTLKEGVVCDHAQTLRVMQGKECVAVVRLSEPIIVAKAIREEPWGYFQFPVIYQAEGTGAIIVKWAMQEDSPSAYGQNAGGRVMSYDEGLTWQALDNDYYEKKRNRVEFDNGDVLQVKNPSSKEVSSYFDFPSPVNPQPIGKQNYLFYYENELPNELRGVYLSLYNASSGVESVIHASLNDPGLLRYSTNGLMPIMWSGEIKQISDNCLVAGVYGTFYQSEDGRLLRNGISFYRSYDGGYQWDIIGKIPFHGLMATDDSVYYYDGKSGFSEPTFAVLENGSYLCIMRNENWNVPMCKAFSYDEGRTWSVPEPFTPNGVKPVLTVLGNGALVLASGRPGVQLRFCIDGDGKTWTEPVDMLHFIDADGKYSSTRETCGYADIIRVDSNTLYLVYSDFLTKDSNGDNRKSILFRKIEVIRR